MPLVLSAMYKLCLVLPILTISMFRWAVQMFKAFDKIQASMAQIEWPFLTLHGDKDKLTDPSGSQLLYDKASSKDKTYKVRANAAIIIVEDNYTVY